MRTHFKPCIHSPSTVVSCQLQQINYKQILTVILTLFFSVAEHVIFACLANEIRVVFTHISLHSLFLHTKRAMSWDYQTQTMLQSITEVRINNRQLLLPNWLFFATIRVYKFRKSMLSESNHKKIRLWFYISFTLILHSNT